MTNPGGSHASSDPGRRPGDVNRTGWRRRRAPERTPATGGSSTAEVRQRPVGVRNRRHRVDVVRGSTARPAPSRPGRRARRWSRPRGTGWPTRCTPCRPSSPRTCWRAAARSRGRSGSPCWSGVAGCGPRPGCCCSATPRTRCPRSGAQGINLALRDAVVAANHLVPALTGQVGGGLAAPPARPAVRIATGATPAAASAVTRTTRVVVEIVGPDEQRRRAAAAILRHRRWVRRRRRPTRPWSARTRRGDPKSSRVSAGCREVWSASEADAPRSERREGSRCAQMILYARSRRDGPRSRCGVPGELSAGRGPRSTHEPARCSDDCSLVEAGVHLVGMTAWGGGGGAVCAVAEPSVSRFRGGGP